MHASVLFCSLTAHRGCFPLSSQLVLNNTLPPYPTSFPLPLCRQTAHPPSLDG